MSPPGAPAADKFLGEGASSGGPFSLLGLPAAPCTDAQILSHLQAQLDKVNSHLHAETPPADEVRLALHAAAAQLLDPVVRKHMIERWSGAPRSPSLPPRPVPPAPAPLPGDLLALEHDAILVLGQTGGWNDRSLRRLAMLALARGIGVDRIPEALRAITRRRRSAAPRQPTPAPHHAAASPRARVITAADTPALAPDESLEPEPRGKGLVITLAIVGSMLLATAILLVVMPLILPKAAPAGKNAGDIATTPPPPPSQTTPQSQPAQSGKADPDPPRQGPPPLNDGPAVRAALARATQGLSIDTTAAITDFERAVTRLSELWVKIPRDELAAIHAEVVQFLYRSAPWTDIAMRAAEAVARPSTHLRRGSRGLSPEEVWPSLWSVGMLARLSREKDLPSGVGAIIDGGLTESLGGGRTPANQSFEAGVLAALGLAPRFMASPAEATAPTSALILADSWRRWIEAVDWSGQADAALRNRILLAGLDTLVRDAPEPDRHQPTFESATLVAQAVDWADAANAQRWLLRALAAPAVSVADIHVITSAMVRQARAPGVDMSMVLPPRANDLQRAELRQHLALAWGMSEEESRDELAEKWASVVDSLAQQAQADVTPVEYLASAARLARANLAAEYRWLGDFAASANLLDHINDPVESALQAPSGSGALELSTDTSWAVRFLASGQNMQVRLALLDELMNSSSRDLSQMDAEVLIQEATRGSRDRVRQRAFEVAERFLNQAVAVNALLEQLHDIPATRKNLELISMAALIRTLSPDDSSWRIKARRGLVERLLQLLAAESDLAAIDRLAELIADSYHTRSLLSPGSSGSLEVPSADISASTLRAAWRRRAEAVLPSAGLGLSLGEIERRRGARAALAEGPVQQFVTEQLSLAELMAYVVAAEQPDLAGDVRAVLDELSAERRRAGHVLQQISICERAIARLWELRLGKGAIQ